MFCDELRLQISRVSEFEPGAQLPWLLPIDMTEHVPDERDRRIPASMRCLEISGSDSKVGSARPGHPIPPLSHSHPFQPGIPVAHSTIFFLSIPPTDDRLDSNVTAKTSLVALAREAQNEWLQP